MVMPGTPRGSRPDRRLLSFNGRGGLAVRAFAVAAVVQIAASGLATGAEGPRAIRIGTDVDAQSLDPRLQRDTTAYRLNNLIYDGLIQLDENLAPRPDLAVSWRQPDDKTWLFTLRRDARFHDDRPVTPEDVVYTFKTILDPVLNARFRSLYEPIAAVEAVGDDQVRFTLKAPYAPLLSYLDLGIVPKDASGRDLNVNPLGSGPFRFSRWERGGRIVLSANDGYFAGRPAIDEIDMILVSDNTARAQALEAGDLDMIMSPLSPQDVSRLAADRRFRHVHLPGISITYFNFNCRHPVLSDPTVRRALAMLIDQNTIVQQIYGGIDVPATSLLIPSLRWSYAPEIRQPAYDVDGARKLLGADGWKPDPDGILAKKGQRLSFTLATHAEDANRIQTIELLQNTLKQVGIEAKASVTDWPAFIGSVQTGNYDMALLGWTILVDPDRAMYGQLSSSGSLNFGHYANEQVDALLARGRAASDRAARAEVYQAAARIIADELPYYVLSYAGFDAFATSSLSGFVPDARGFLRGLAAP
jgi:peptide/nickel transport system substrate-binding protein